MCHACTGQLHPGFALLWDVSMPAITCRLSSMLHIARGGFIAWTRNASPVRGCLSVPDASRCCALEGVARVLGAQACKCHLISLRCLSSLSRGIHPRRTCLSSQIPSPCQTKTCLSSHTCHRTRKCVCLPGICAEIAPGKPQQHPPGLGGCWLAV